jgi:hypothetical protein
VLWLFIVPMGLRDIWRAVRVPGASPPIVIAEQPHPPEPDEDHHE